MNPSPRGVAQAKDYAGKLAIRFAYSSNGQGIYGIDMDQGTEGELQDAVPLGSLRDPSPGKGRGPLQSIHWLPGGTAPPSGLEIYR
jgi:hypothetical protein